MNQKAKFSVFRSVNDHQLFKSITIGQMEEWAKSPGVGEKEVAPVIAPHDGTGKTKKSAEASQYWAIVVDHDEGNVDESQILSLYGGVAHIAFTTSSHLQDGKGSRWKVLLPLLSPLGVDDYFSIARGASIVMGGDKSQARVQQIFYAPNKVSHDAPYKSFSNTDLPAINIKSGLGLGFFDVGKEAEEKENIIAVGCLPKAYKGENENGGVIGQFNQNYEPGNILEANSYKKAGKRWRCPNSTSGIPGVIMLPDSEPARVYSHHGSDPLADGHSHDAFSVFCQVEHNGNMAAAVSSAAKLLGIDREPLALDEQSQKMVDGIMGKTVKNLSDHVKPKEERKPEVITAPHPGPLPVGALRDAEQWIASGVHTVKKDALTQSVLAFACSVTSRRYVTHDGQPAAAYLGVTDSSLSGVRLLTNPVATLCAKLGERNALHTGDISTRQAVYRHLFRHPRLFWVTDTYGTLVQGAKRQTNGAYEGVLSALQKCYSGDTQYLDPEAAGVVGQKMRTISECDIHSPSITVLAFISEAHLDSMASRNEYGRGTLHDMAIIPGGDVMQGHHPERGKPIPKSVAALVKSLADVKGMAGAEQNCGIEPSVTVVEWEKTTVSKMVRDWRDKMYAYMDVDARSQYKGFVYGYRETAIRLAACLSSWESPEYPVVTPKIMQWCLTWCERCLRLAMPRLEVSSRDADGKPATMQLVLEVLMSNKTPLTARDIGQKCFSFRKLLTDEKEAMLNSLADDGVVIASKDGRSNKYLIASK